MAPPQYLDKFNKIKDSTPTKCLPLAGKGPPPSIYGRGKAPAQSCFQTLLIFRVIIKNLISRVEGVGYEQEGYLKLISNNRMCLIYKYKRFLKDTR
jgi:hypothetical protein